MSTKPNQPNREEAIIKLQTLLTTHSRLKTDEELASSFDKFYASNLEGLDSAEMEQRLKDLKALEEFWPVLDELADELRRHR